jgi:hypothetical protein
MRFTSRITPGAFAGIRLARIAVFLIPLLARNRPHLCQLFVAQRGIYAAKILMQTLLALRRTILKQLC